MSRSARLGLLHSFMVASLSLACSTPKPAPKPPEAKAQNAAVQVPEDKRYLSLPEPSDPPKFTAPTAHKSELNNGLSVWRMQHGDTPLVSIHLMMSTGSSQDPKGKEGLTLLSADLLDEGAGKLNALELSDRLGELATDYSSSAGVDYVLLSMSALAENLEPSLELLASMVQQPRLDKSEFDRRKEHHLASTLSSRDDPREARGRALATALFGDGYAGRASTGTLDSIKAITPYDVKAHVKRLAVPDGSHLVVAGNVDDITLSKLAEKYFGKWTGKLKTTPAQLSNEPEGKVVYIVDFKDATQSSLVVARRAGADGDPNYFAEEVMNDRLGGSFTGRINMNLREDKGYTYGAQSIFRRYHYAGFWGVYTDVISQATVASVKEILGELEAVCKDRPLSDVERNEAVDGMLLGFVMDFAETESLGLRLASLPLRDRPVDYWTTWPKNISQISTQRMNEAAQPYCDSSQFSVVVAGDKEVLSPEFEKLGLTVVEMDLDGKPIKLAP